ncbi:ABC transporter ATP-binding protein [Natronosporangium hydrolyticum]|uniref:ABC transporter ATP-binding protein n=1 Tax=Natronosporangium hydrolyticum TaxID=2811111 RepID=A0A895Y7E3_9ACTN|nr:ABC transporter ATP-binding protein [Natronosporangium hydrolyticum]QSB13281.1 ABC transporter ATP-binding protein [Natronosporangium hydrolyticum]
MATAERGGFAMVVLLQAIGAVAGLAPLLAVVELGRTLLLPDPVDHRHVWTVVAVGALGLVVQLLFTAASSGIGHLLDARVQLSLRRQLAASLGRVPIGWLAGRRTGELAKVVGDDVSAVHPFIAHTPGALVSALVVPLVSLGYLFTIDWRLTLITLIPVLLAMLLVPLLMLPSRLREEREFDAAMGRVADSVVEFVQGIAVVKAFGGGERAHRRFRTATNDFVDALGRKVRGLSGVAAGMQLALSPPFVILVVLLGGTALVTTGGLAPADVLPFLLLGLGLTAPVSALVNHSFEDVQAARRAVGRIREVLAVPPLPEPAQPAAPAGHRVELREVRFGYHSDHEVLCGINLVLAPGTVTALVGPSGSGKSTLVQLLPRFFDPTGGSVRLGGVDLREIRSQDLYRRVSFVFQETSLLRESVAENIALAVPHADADEVVRAAQVGAFGAAVAGYAALRYSSDLSGFRVGTTLLRGMYHRIGDHLARLPIGWYTAGRVGEVSVLASQGVLQTMGLIAHLLAPFIFASVTPLTIVVVMLAVNWQLGVAALVAVPLVAAAQVWTGRAVAANDADRAARDHQAAGRVIEYLQAQPVLRTGGRAAERFRLLDDSLAHVASASRRMTLSVLPGAVGLTLAVQAGFTGLLVLGAYLALGGNVGAAELLAILVLAARCADPLLSLADLGGQLRNARSELARLDRLLRTEPLPEPREPVQPRGHDLEFESVTFRRGGRRVLNDLCLSVPAGQRLAIVGPSGAGKTTLLQLVARFHDVDAGAVRIGGVDVRSINTETLMAQIGFVFQEVYLFDGTIEENVRLGRPEASVAEVRQAASAAGLDEVIVRLPSGWETSVGEGGARLSGGERQRVAIARALLKDAPVVLLDEVTSALDSVNEAAVHEGIERLMTSRTVVMVTHRLRTVQRADRVAFVVDGRIVAEDSHEELLRRDNGYREFWRPAMTPVLR